MAKIRKNDTVIVITGKDKGKTGKVLKVFPKEDKVLIEGVNIKKVHQKPRKRGEKGQVIEKAFPIHVSNVMLYVDGKKTRVGYAFIDGKKVRISKVNKKEI